MLYKHDVTGLKAPVKFVTRCVPNSGDHRYKFEFAFNYRRILRSDEATTILKSLFDILAEHKN